MSTSPLKAFRKDDKVMSSAADIIRDSINEFSRLQNWMKSERMGLSVNTDFSPLFLRKRY